MVTRMAPKKVCECGLSETFCDIRRSYFRVMDSGMVQCSIPLRLHPRFVFILHAICAGRTAR